MRTYFFTCCLALILINCQPKSTERSTAETQESSDKMAWWRDARFGMFIHWGLYAVPAGEWNGEKIPGISEWIMYNAEIPVAEYEKLADRFNPVEFNADDWVKLASEAGMKYLVITSKHHDGFAMFHSKTDPYNIVDATPFDRDPLMELAEACKKYDIKLGFYHSQAQDWHHPGGTYATWRKKEYWDKSVDRQPLDIYIDEKVAPQVREILTNYGDIAIMWWDTPVDMTEEAAEKLHVLLDLQPGIIENNRLYGPWKGDFSTPEQHIPPTGLDYDWEVCMTMNTSWGYKYYDDNWKSDITLIRYLTDIASKGGNFLLNVGPTAEGRIPQPSIDRLKSIGKWMNQNGESIYGSMASPFFKLPWGRCTRKMEGQNTILYLHVFDLSPDKMIKIPGLRNEVVDVVSLAQKGNLSYTRMENDVVVDLNGLVLDPANTVLKMRIKGEPDVISNMPRQLESGEIILPAYTSFIHNPGYGEHAELSDLSEEAYIDHWIDPQARVEFMFEVVDPGEFEVWIEGQSLAENTRLQISDDDSAEELNWPGSDQLQFTERNAGTFSIDTAGLVTISLKKHPESIQDFKLRRIRLTKD